MPVNPLSGYRHIALYDPSSADQVQVPARVLVDSSVPEEEEEDIFVSGDGSERVLSRVTSLSLSYLDSLGENGLDQIRSWEDNETKIRSVGLGIGDLCYQWYESSLVRTLPRKNNALAFGDKLTRLVSQKRQPNIHQNSNLLYYNGWDDSDADNVPDGWTITLNTGSLSNEQFNNPTLFHESEFQFDTGSSLDADIWFDVIFPVDDAHLVFGADLTLGDASVTMHIEGLDYTDVGFNPGAVSPITSDSYTVQSDGVSAVRDIMGTEYRAVRVRFNVSSSTNTTVKIKNPFLGTIQAARGIYSTYAPTLSLEDIDIDEEVDNQPTSVLSDAFYTATDTAPYFSFLPDIKDLSTLSATGDDPVSVLSDVEYNFDTENTPTLTLENIDIDPDG